MNTYVALVLFPLPGLLLTILTIVFGWVLFPSIIHSEVEKQIRLVEGSDTWGKWKEAPIPIYLSFYIHHVTNPDEVENGLKPVFEEKGPYAYRQKRMKVDIRQEDGKNTVRYKEVKTYFFDQEKSGNNSEDDLVNFPNIPFVGVIHTIRKMIPLDIVAALVGNIILSEEPFMKKNIPVRELLFEGFDVTRYTNSLLRSQLPKDFAGGRFGLYKGKNGTASEEWEVYTGVENSNDFGRVKTWDGRSQLGFWRKLSSCDKLKGTDGSIFHPFLTKQSVLEAFSSDVCRSIALSYDMDMEHLGIPGYRFTAPEWSFADPRVNEENRCFCLEDNLEDCAHAGVLPLESCLNAPVWSSPPHFLDSDIRYLADSGLDPPDREKHGTFIDVEPTTGLLLRAHKRLQINLEVRHNRKVRALQRLTKDKMLFPLIWADESAELDENIANQLKGQLFTPLKIVGIAKWVVLVLGLGLLVFGIVMFVQRYVLQNPGQKKKVGLDLARPSTNSLRGSSIDTVSKRRKKSAAVAQKMAREASSTSGSSISYID